MGKVCSKGDIAEPNTTYITTYDKKDTRGDRILDRNMIKIL
jgi:hypothetical protein